jgi:hypothetical protein
LLPACASVSRIRSGSNATSFNISLAVSDPSFTNRVVFIGAPLLAQTTAVTIVPLGINWLLFCKNCASVEQLQAQKSGPRTRARILLMPRFELFMQPNIRRDSN